MASGVGTRRGQTSHAPSEEAEDEESGGFSDSAGEAREESEMEGATPEIEFARARARHFEVSAQKKQGVGETEKGSGAVLGKLEERDRGAAGAAREQAALLAQDGPKFACSRLVRCVEPRGEGCAVRRGTGVPSSVGRIGVHINGVWVHNACTQNISSSFSHE